MPLWRSIPADARMHDAAGMRDMIEHFRVQLSMHCGSTRKLKPQSAISIRMKHAISVANVPRKTSGDRYEHKGHIETRAVYGII